MSTPSLNLGVDAVPVATAGLGVAKAGIEFAAQLDKEENTPAMIDAAIETHAQMAIDKVQKAIAEKDLAMLQRMCQP